ncbi:site-specific DNA-methyltransferase [Staphylococcus epidermidis]|uniref:site-specific DNA-methyltransferase n=1 Tax=Staphylococcus epidermidis TaxID=1282 RepID=UPI00026BFA07|nr:site-specific DNA-methyltransferase [Staphylococcus epidermidis]EJE19243.1 hypothetical protein HMPREF9977_10904 [Staphylococcus epidermidis NIHLM008]MDU5017570.1 site-specific DNA-methyltransferase [Corynebacterium sp.]
MTEKPEKINLSDINKRKVDNNLLNELRNLFKHSENQKERYNFTWNGKTKAYFEAASPTTKTLSPQPEESMDFKNSDNLFITGDNLEVLKLLQESYLDKIDIIYIDPPYNTGKDFIYHDNFKKNKKDADLAEGNVNEEGNQLIKNEKSSGRYHSDWLTMMYPRLKLARNLLSDTGVIFVSVDDNEQANLKLLMDEVFGEDNFLANVIWERAYAPINLKKNFSENHDYILTYCRNSNIIKSNGLERTESADSLYKNPDNDPRGVWQSDNLSVGPAVEKNVYEIITPSGKSVFPPNGRSWLLSQERFQEYLDDNRIWFGSDDSGVPRIKRFLSEVKQTTTPMTIWKYQDVGHSQSASQELKKLFSGKSYFTYPKPVSLIKRIIELYSNKESTILDFFAGSSTTAEAIMKKNNEDGGHRKYIMVQLDEMINDKSKAHGSDYKTIDQISRERIRRAAKKLDDTSGFRALKVDKTRLNENIFKTANDLNQEDLLFDIDNQLENRSDYDLLYDILIDSALEFNKKIEHESISGENIIKYDYSNEMSGIVAYFDNNLTDTLIQKIAKLKPLIAVFKESTFNKSAQKVNVLEQFRIISPDTKVKVI